MFYSYILSGKLSKCKTNFMIINATTNNATKAVFRISDWFNYTVS